MGLAQNLHSDQPKNDNDFIPTELPSNLMSLRRKIAFFVALVMIVSVLISYLLWLRFGVYTYERRIVRKPASLQEAMALTVAEYFNYSDTFGKQTLTPIYLRDPMFIDAEAIQYYNDRFDNLMEQSWGKPKSVRFSYEAKVFSWDRIHVIGDSGIQVQSQNGSVLIEYDPSTLGPAEFAQWNGSDYKLIDASDIDFSLPKSYVVEMTLENEEHFGPLAASVVHAHQLVIMDEHFVAVLLCISSWLAVA